MDERVSRLLVSSSVLPPTDTLSRPELIPAYVPPAELEAMAPRWNPGAMVVVNPASGVGEARDPAYARAIAVLQAAQLDVLGYVATGYGARSRAEVEAEAATYLDWYGVSGLFLDEAPTSPDALPAFAALCRAVRHGSVAINPGTVPDPGYFAVADVVVTFEGPLDAYDEVAATGPEGVDAARTARLVYDAPEAEHARIAASGPSGAIAYATSGVLPNPWGTVAPSTNPVRATP